MSSLVASLIWSLLPMKAFLAACHWAAAAFSKTLKSTDSSCATMVWTRLLTTSMPCSIIGQHQGKHTRHQPKACRRSDQCWLLQVDEFLLQQQAHVEQYLSVTSDCLQLRAQKLVEVVNDRHHVCQVAADVDLQGHQASAALIEVP